VPAESLSLHDVRWNRPREERRTAVNADLTQFVRDALARGVPRDTIRAKLAEARWRPEEIDAALASWADTEFPIPVPQRRAYLSAREAFLYLVLFVTLYTSAFNVGAMLFQFIERWLPDPRPRAAGRAAGSRRAVCATPRRHC
jgi:hypothetical protein